MKRIILSVLIILMLLSINVFAENTTDENKTTNSTTNETSAESKEEKPTSTKKNETMYVQERCNIRSSYSVDSDRVGGLDAGTEVTVVEEYSNGWYKIKYDGGEAFIKAGILRSTKPDSPEENTVENETTEEKTENTTSEEKVSEESAEVMDEEETKLMNEIGTLPEVGHNIANYLYIGIVIMAFVGTIYIVKKENN